MGRHKKHRGGQPGNQNARKHGFYASKLTEQDLAELWRTCNERGTDPGLAMLHVKLLFILRRGRQNPRLLRELARQYNKYLYARFGNNDEAKIGIRGIVREFIRSIKNGEIFVPGQIEPEP